MALSFATALRNNRLDEITSYVGASAVIRIYAGTRPSNGGAETTILAELTGDVTAFAGAASGGVLTIADITADSSANATGTASWFRILQSNGTTQCIDGDISTQAAGTGDMQLDDTSIISGGSVSLGGPNTITEGNA